MKLHRDQTDDIYTFSGYGEGYVAIQGNQITGNLVVLPGRLIKDWTQATFDDLSEADFDFLA
ncbi:MAG TPA: hypothetical protein VFK74_04185, partial [Azospira sp.]|nr:hypothetical protein [Azospira sp.]